jgi:hypothetical protein
MTNSIFSDTEAEVYKYRWEGGILIANVHGGTPTDPKVAEGFIKTKLALKDDLLREMVAKTMAERGVSATEAAEEVAANRTLSGFKRDELGLYLEGRHLKACLKEAISVAIAGDHLKVKGWGKTNKGLLAFMAEHIFVVEDRLHLGVSEPSGINQHFVHTWNTDAISNSEYVLDAKMSFTIISDYDFPPEFWKTVWVIAQHQGIGAKRSMGYGTFVVTKWETIG